MLFFSNVRLHTRRRQLNTKKFFLLFVFRFISSISKYTSTVQVFHKQHFWFIIFFVCFFFMRWCRLLLLDRDRQAAAVRASPPPTYRSHAGTLLRYGNDFILFLFILVGVISVLVWFLLFIFYDFMQFLVQCFSAQHEHNSVRMLKRKQKKKK